MKFIASLIALLVFAAPVWAQSKSPGTIAREQGQAVVIVEALDERGSVIGQGSGFIATPNGAIVSNLHVVQGAAMLRVKLPNGDVYKTADLVDVDDVKDIAIIKIKGFKLPTVTLGDSDQAETGDSVVAISSPEGLVNSLTTGVISAVRRLETHRVFQITAPISRGSSAKLQPPLKPEPENKTEDIYNTDQPIQSQIVTANRGKLGLTEQEPVFVRPDEALALFYRLVAGIGLYNFKEVGDQTRTAALVKTSDSDEAEEFTIKYLSFRSGLAMSFAKPDRLLTSVELLVTWSVEDLKNTFGDKFKKRTVNKQQILDFGKLPGGQQVIAVMDGNGNVRSVKFTKAK